MRARRAKASPTLQLKPGDRVLVGGRGCMPWQWFFATVLWADRHEVLTEHQPPSASSNEMHRQVLPIEHIRAAGSLSALIDYKKSCSAAAKELTARVDECERALGAARDAVFAKLDQIHATLWQLAAEHGREMDAVSERLEALQDEERALDRKRDEIVGRRSKARAGG